MRKRERMRLFTRSILICAVLTMSLSAFAQLNSNAVDVTLQATLNETLSITLNSGNSQSIASITPAAVNNFAGGPANVTTTWVMKPGRTAVALYAYFSSATAAMAHTDAANTVDIPSGAIKAQLNGAGAFNPLVNTVPFGGANAGLQLFSTNITGANRNASHTDTVALELDLTGTVNGQDMKQLPADVYNGTLHIQAQATP
jgi:hypothetical protein